MHNTIDNQLNKILQSLEFDKKYLFFIEMMHFTNLSFLLLSMIAYLGNGFLF